MTTVTELLYAVTTLVLVVTGLTIVGMGIRAYRQTSRTAMLYLSVGFTFAVVGAAVTTVTAFVTGFQRPQSLLFVNSGLTTVGFLFVIYSLVNYE